MKKIHCFIFSAVISLFTILNLFLLAINEPLGLLQEISCLYLVNTQLFIQYSKIKIEDPNIRKTIYKIFGLKLVYCYNHSFVIYLKSILSDLTTS